MLAPYTILTPPRCLKLNERLSGNATVKHTLMTSLWNYSWQSPVLPPFPFLTEKMLNLADSDATTAL